MARGVFWRWGKNETVKDNAQTHKRHITVQSQRNARQVICNPIVSGILGDSW